MKPPPCGRSRESVDRSEGPPTVHGADTFRNCKTELKHYVCLWGEVLAKWVIMKECYLDDDELLLQSFSIWKLLSEAHVDGVLWRATTVLSKLFQFWTQIKAEPFISECKQNEIKFNIINTSDKVAVLFTEVSKKSTPTIHVLLKAEELHHGVLGQLSWLWVSH